MTIDTAHILGSPKTSINGLLSAAALVLIAALAVPPGSRWPVYALAGLRALNGAFQQDAGKQLAIPDGGSEAKVMDAHEDPNQPGAEVVK